MPGSVFTRSDLPGDPATWPKYRKKVLTAFTRMEGPFMVDTGQGVLLCNDGYLGIDARGYPYPVAKDEFDLIYEEAE